MDTIIPKEEHIKQWELNKALAENQRLRDEFEEKDKIIAKIQEVQNKLFERT